MKKIFFASLSLCLFLLACSKNENKNDHPVPEGQKVAINFSASNFLQKFEQMPTGRSADKSSLARDSALASKITNLYYLVFDQFGRNKRIVHQRATDPDFGNLSDSLLAGHYRVVLMGAMDSLPLQDSAYMYFIRNNTPVAYPDFFYNAKDINIRPDSARVFNFDLTRRVANLEVNILDASGIVPDSAISVGITEQSIFNIFSGTSSSMYGGQYYLPRKNGFTFSSLYADGYGETSVTISYPSKTNPGVRLTRVISNVKLTPNTKTVLSGNIYAPLPEGPGKLNSGFNLSVQNLWGPTVETSF